MSRFAKLLERAGLIETDTVALDVVPAEEAYADSGATFENPTPMFQIEGEAGGAPFDGISRLDVTPDEIYAHANLPASRYPAERLLRLLDGLAAMDENTRLAAVTAMDQADDTWSLEDPIQDARNKATALEAFATSLESDLQRLTGELDAQIQDSQAREGEEAARIRSQIADLEALLARRVETGAQERTQFEAQRKVLAQETASQVKALKALSSRLRALVFQFPEKEPVA